MAEIGTIDGNSLVLADQKDRLKSAAWSLDGNFLITADKILKIWTMDGKCIATLSNDSTSIQFIFVAWSPDGKHLISVRWGGEIVITDMSLFHKIMQYVFSCDEINLIKKISDVKENNNKYELSEQEQIVFDQLANADQELQSALFKLLKQLVQE